MICARSVTAVTSSAATTSRYLPSPPLFISLPSARRACHLPSIMGRSSESLPEAEVQRRAPLQRSPDLAAIELEAQIQPEGAHRRVVAETETHAAAEFAEIEVRYTAEDVAAIDEDGGADIAPDRHTQLAVEENDRIAARREPGRRDRVRR